MGIVAHVDAGKTSLTERLLYAAGVIDRIGRVDDGNTQTDSMDLERKRGITIRSAVVSFALGDLPVNLIDTPGHSDFIAEVERSFSLLDGAVLVVSAVEGVTLEDGPVTVSSAKLVSVQGERSIVELVIHEGRNRIVRRLLDHVGHPVRRLTRTAIGPVLLGRLGQGARRELTLPELGELLDASQL